VLSEGGVREWIAFALHITWDTVRTSAYCTPLLCRETQRRCSGCETVSPRMASSTRRPLRSIAYSSPQAWCSAAAGGMPTSLSCLSTCIRSNA
jgi:hypothetical protein